MMRSIRNMTLRKRDDESLTNQETVWVSQLSVAKIIFIEKQMKETSRSQ